METHCPERESCTGNFESVLLIDALTEDVSLSNENEFFSAKHQGRLCREEKASKGASKAFR